MSLIDPIRKIPTFFSEVKGELKKSTWPSRDELVESTIVVILSVILLGVFIGVSDKVLELVIKVITT